jgi:hypothetical protein
VRIISERSHEFIKRISHGLSGEIIFVEKSIKLECNNCDFRFQSREGKLFALVTFIFV